MTVADLIAELRGYPGTYNVMVKDEGSQVFRPVTGTTPGLNTPIGQTLKEVAIIDWD